MDERTTEWVMPGMAFGIPAVNLTPTGDNQYEVRFYDSDGALQWETTATAVQGTSSAEYVLPSRQIDFDLSYPGWIYDNDSAPGLDNMGDIDLSRYVEPMVDDAHDYLTMAHGSRAYQREVWLDYKARYFDVKFGEEVQSDIEDERGGALDDFLNTFVIIKR